MLEFFILPFIIMYKFYKYLQYKFVKVTFRNKTVWITGASSGIGEALTYKFAELGAIVIISARRENELKRVKDSCIDPDKIMVFPLDLADPEQAASKANEFLASKNIKVDILINNSGVSMRAGFLECSLKTDREMMSVNYFGPIALTRVVLPNMLKDGLGQIVLINSISGKIGTPLRTTYCGSKFGLCGYFDAVRAEFKDQGITVTSIYPGYVRTDISKNSYGPGDVKFGKTDSNIAKGMDVGLFAQKAIQAIYFKENEAVISKEWYLNPVIWLRNIWPDLVFYLSSLYKSRLVEAAKKSDQMEFANGKQVSE